MSATLGRAPPVAGWAGAGLGFAAAWGFATVGFASVGFASAPSAGSDSSAPLEALATGDPAEASPLPSDDLAAARISATDNFFFSAIVSLTASQSTPQGSSPFGGTRNRVKSMFRPQLREFVKFFTNSS
jgi:hypothetical protein